jgi:hypothetical protein
VFFFSLCATSRQTVYDVCVYFSDFFEGTDF